MAQAKNKDFKVQLRSIWIDHLTPEGVDSINRINSKERRSIHLRRGAGQADFDMLCEGLRWVTKLYVSGNENITDISAISNLDSLELFALTSLYRSREEALDLQPIGTLSALIDLSLHGTRVTNTKALGQLKRLRKLDLYMSEVSSLSFLYDTPQLRELNLHGSNHTFKNYEPVASLEELTYLDIYANSQATDEGLEVLKALTKLRKIDMKYNKEVTSLSFLENNLDIEEISARQCSNLLDFSVLARFKKLRSISFARTRLDNLDMLREVTTLEEFYVDGTRITDVSFLRNCRKLKRVNITNTRIKDISPLTNCYIISSLKLDAIRDFEYRSSIKQIKSNNPELKIDYPD